jgi:hypothetical protein
MRIYRLLATTIATVALSTPALAAWTVRDQGASFEAFTRNQAGTAALVLSCRRGGATAMLKIVMPSASGWNPNAPVSLEINGREFPVSIEGGGEQVILSDAAGGVLGIADATLQAIRAGRVLTLVGAAAEAMPAPVRGFDLAGSGKAIDQLTEKCGLSRTLAPHSAALPDPALPLTQGEYTDGRCANPPDVLRSIGIYALTDGPNAGRQFISPTAEGIDGFCYLKGGLKVSGNVYSGTPSCDSGGRASTDIGRYRFSYQIINNKTFISNGKTYSWCVAHR